MPELNLQTPGISFRPTNASFHPCSFELKINEANAGLSAAFRELWTKVEDVSNNLYQESPPQAQENWFSELLNTRIDSGITRQYKAIQDKYHPERVYAVHPALDPYWYQPDSFYGAVRGGTRKGLRDPYYRPVIEINPNIPPVVNLFNHYKQISDELLGKSSLVAPSENTLNSIPREESPLQSLNIIPRDIPIITT